ncbi:histidine triad nucleotide-binding protein [Croceivirga thetidis]|nr:histidine triad nucleotide-binding protein [Croceivirga thetidis]
MKIVLVSICSLVLLNMNAQSEAYQKQKAEKIAAGSVFTKIVNREAPATIVYEDEDVIAFLPLRPQAKVHYLIVPKKEIHTVNDLEEEDALVMGKLFLVAKKLAKQFNIAETGYRLAMNINEDAGQSVFHLHLHFLGGEKLPPMLPRKEKE